MALSTLQKLIPMIALGFAALPAQADFTLTNDSSQVVYVLGRYVHVAKGIMHLRIGPGTAPGQSQPAETKNAVPPATETKNAVAPPTETKSAPAPAPLTAFAGDYDRTQSLQGLVCALPPGGILTVSSEDRSPTPGNIQRIGLAITFQTWDGHPFDRQDRWWLFNHYILNGEGLSLHDDPVSALCPPNTAFQLEILPNGRDLSVQDPKPGPACVIL